MRLTEEQLRQAIETIKSSDLQTERGCDDAIELLLRVPQMDAVLICVSIMSHLDATIRTKETLIQEYIKILTKANWP